MADNDGDEAIRDGRSPNRIFFLQTGVIYRISMGSQYPQVIARTVMMYASLSYLCSATNCAEWVGRATPKCHVPRAREAGNQVDYFLLLSIAPSGLVASDLMRMEDTSQIFQSFVISLVACRVWLNYRNPIYGHI